MAVDFKKVMGVAKKNAVSISAGVIALAAIAVPFVYVDGLVAETQQKMDARKGVNDQLTSLSGKSRKLINVNPTNAEVPALESFPTEATVKAGEAAKVQLEAESKKVLESALKINRREPLVPSTFTQGADAVTQFRRMVGEFTDKYRAQFPEELNKRVKGGTPIIAAEVDAMVMGKKVELEQQMAVRQNGQIMNAPQIAEAQAKMMAEYPQQIRNSIALKNQVYVSLDTWQHEPELVMPGVTPRIESAWFGQVGLWIQQEVADIVKGINGNSANVLGSPIKHLVAVRYQSGSTGNGPYTYSTGPYVVSKAPGAEGGTAVAPLTGTDPAAALTLAKTVTATGRQASGLYDVVGFYMVVRVEESKVTEVLAAIPRGRLVNVLNVSMRSVDADAALQEGFVYGKAPVVELFVECEMLMLRSWTSNLIPTNVRQAIGVDAFVAPVQPGGGMPGM